MEEVTCIKPYVTSPEQVSLSRRSSGKSTRVSPSAKLARAAAKKVGAIPHANILHEIKVNIYLRA